MQLVYKRNYSHISLLNDGIQILYNRNSCTSWFLLPIFYVIFNILWVVCIILQQKSVMITDCPARKTQVCKCDIHRNTSKPLTEVQIMTELCRLWCRSQRSFWIVPKITKWKPFFVQNRPLWPIYCHPPHLTTYWPQLPVGGQAFSCLHVYTCFLQKQVASTCIMCKNTWLFGSHMS